MRRRVNQVSMVLFLERLSAGIVASFVKHKVQAMEAGQPLNITQSSLVLKEQTTLVKRLVKCVKS